VGSACVWCFVTKVPDASATIGSGSDGDHVAGRSYVVVTAGDNSAV